MYENREIDELIQQIQLNANKYQEVIEWIPFGRLENVAYLAKGGFGTAYKANWLDGFIYSHKNQKKKWYEFGKQVVWNRYGKKNVCLKSLSNLTDNSDFLQEIKNQLKLRGKNVIAIYGITKNPTENEYMMVMDYAEYGSLRNLLNNNFKKLTWRRKYNVLSSIVIGLTNIHEMGLMHKDFHSGNIVNQNLTLSYITDFGLCKPVTENNPENIYGVIPYMAPETLSRGEYTQASDIYSFGMVMLEVLTSYQPYYNIPHDATLAKDICEGLKPEIKCEIPKFLKEIMEKCWNFEPLNQYGSLRNLLNDNFKKLTWRRKYNILSSIVIGLTNIHEMGLMHKDFHSGNIVNQNLTLSYITDFGLCKPVTENNPENIYGVIPYMAPETLSRGEYTQASDIYSFGMVMLEVLTSYQPYYNIPHDATLAKDICEGLKPEIKCEIPKFLKEIMEKCWNFEPLNRPTAEELKSQLEKYISDDNEIRKQVNKQINDANKSNKNSIQYDPNEMHPEAIYTSRHLPFVTHNTKQYDFVIPDDIIEEVEENEIQEN
ncbi:hypothetical protein Glove_154g30 [Diversispora epigaea]|uniref:Protein kinase domain-containing protein n=1 Tax=Diversispora epigaea TaxID=1348612 RepID=A0A397IYT6_9GLOM|nr:hypothetical protein Glove_154g30 [Diversispora epigaea]